MKMNLKAFDVVLVDFGDDVIGSEQGGERPSIIIQNDKGNIHSPTTLVLPLTKQLKNLYQPTHTLINKGLEKGLIVDSMVLGEAVRQISEKRIQKYLGKISDTEDKKRILDAFYAGITEVA